MARGYVVVVLVVSEIALVCVDLGRRCQRRTIGCFPAKVVVVVVLVSHSLSYSRNRRQFGIFFLFLLIEGFSFSPRFYLLLVGEGMLSQTKFPVEMKSGGSC